MTLPHALQPVRIADARRGVRHVFVRDLVVACRIGVHDHEKQGPQRVRLNLDLAVWDKDVSQSDDIAHVVCYEDIVTKARALVSGEHVHLVETLAERIAQACLENTQVRSVRVRVEKLDVFADAASVGVEIERFSGLE
ncbi:MAG: dihydroneopterin aldolase [Alphaproteobacteria bacterium RIFOXYD12_FULL_60_8]|nr:MAG: dihydroneopterin aldolase [Alphaproteobacteria bacterium RIFOXYD12_FULL_60_8]